MKVLHVCSELYPLLKTGGLADVMGSLPFAQKEIGIDARIPPFRRGFRKPTSWLNLIILPDISFCATANMKASAFI